MKFCVINYKKLFKGDMNMFEKMYLYSLDIGRLFEVRSCMYFFCIMDVVFKEYLFI